jgi:hypothetical protein
VSDDRVDDLRSTSDAVSREVESLEAMERKKQETDPTGPEMLELSRAARRAAERVRDLAIIEEELAERVADDNDPSRS